MRERKIMYISSLSQTIDSVVHVYLIFMCIYYIELLVIKFVKREKNIHKFNRKVSY